MTTMTYTASAITSTPISAFDHAVRAFTKINDFLNICFGATAEEDSAFRGLDLNGNPMWARR